MRHSTIPLSEHIDHKSNNVHYLILIYLSTGLIYQCCFLNSLTSRDASVAWNNDPVEKLPGNNASTLSIPWEFEPGIFSTVEI